MPDIYDQHKAAFANVSAYVSLSDHSSFPKAPERFATIAFKFPKDGAGRLYAYVHVFGQPMVRGFAASGGYDKHSAAVANAISKITERGDCDGTDAASLESFCRALATAGGSYWDRKLAAVGFTVLQAV